MAILVPTYEKLGHSLHHRDPSCLVELYLETVIPPAVRDLKISCIDTSRHQLKSAK
jgi:hypothetical protein